MNILRSALPLAALLLLLTSPQLFAQGGAIQQIGLNRIEGRVTDENGSPVDNAYVELYSNLGSMVNRQRSTGAGMFSFRGMGPGRYTIRVKPFGTNLAEDSKDIEVNNQSSRSDTVMVDFRLRKDRRFSNPTPELTGVVFAQDVPAEAKRLYTSAIAELDTSRAKFLADLEEAIRLFPKYFDALRALGKAYVLAGEHEKGYPYLLRALDVNVRCPDCYYTVGLAFYKLQQNALGLKAADAAALLSPESSAVQLLRGMLFLQDNNIANAETALKSANTLAKGANAEVHWQLAHVYNRTKRNKEAAQELEEYLKLKPDLNADEKQNVRSLIDKMKNAKT